MEYDQNRVAAVIGAGPAGLYGARYLANAGINVALINRDIKPGGLAEYGIYYDKYKMKQGLRKQFRQIIDNPKISYFGNITVGEKACLSLDDLRRMGFDAILVTVGAQGTKWLGLPGEQLKGVFHAKDLVYHYNILPPFSTQPIEIGKRVALVGAGNVMMDIAHWMIRDRKVSEVVVVVRRGPAEVKFDKKEMEVIAANLDIPALDAELGRVRPIMETIGQDVAAAREYILAGLPKALEPISDTRFRFIFLASPTEILGDRYREVRGLMVEHNTLVRKGDEIKAQGLGVYQQMDVDTVVFAIGDRVDNVFGLPVQWNEFVKNPWPAYPIDGISYEAYDPNAAKSIEGVFVAGWSREASSGLVGVARKDGENGARAVVEYLKQAPPKEHPEAPLAALEALLAQSPQRVVVKEDLRKLEEYEQTKAQRLNLEDYKLKTNEEMLSIIALQE
jgi:ferredoxin--NADP+ reductase